MFNNLLNPIFNPLLSLPHFWGILIISFIVTVIITLIYKLVTDQEVMKTLKEDMKASQKLMKELKDHPKKMMAVQKQAMEKNMQYMMASMKPTLFTLLPIIIIFGWLGAHLAYEPLMPGNQFDILAEFSEGTTGTIELIVPSGVNLLSDAHQEILNNKVIWVLSGDAGDYNLQIKYNGEVYDKQLIISDSPGQYAEPVMPIKGSNLKVISASNEKVIAMNLFGWKVGWLGTYIIFSIIFSTILRKILKLH